LIAALAACGWVCAALALWRTVVLERRMELVACAEHELRGPLAALSLAAARARPLPATVVEGQLERARLALADLVEARRGRRAAPQAKRHDPLAVARRAAAAWDVRLEWSAGRARVVGDAARLSQALGNLLSNALEHGGGHAELRGVRRDGRVRIEVADRGPGMGGRPEPDRGRGLAIAARAVEEAGGWLALSSGPDGTVAAVELPLAEP
jgi:signal transduction histidine kinase